MIVGYGRTSSLDQVAGLDAQIRDLKAHGCERIFSEQVSSVGSRPELDNALGFVREGDILVVTKLCRLARSVTHLGVIIDTLKAKGVALRIIDLGIDTSTSSGKLILTIMGGIAEFERSLMLERQREGIAKAKNEGRYKGRKPTARIKSDDVKTLRAAGHSVRDIGTRLGIGKSSVHRALSATE